MKNIWNAIIIILIAALVLGFSLSPIKGEEKLVITKKSVVYECNNVVKLLVETKGYEGVGITFFVGLITPDAEFMVVPELDDKIDVRKIDMTGFEEGIYTFLIKAKHGDSWENCATSWIDFLYLECVD